MPSISYSVIKPASIRPLVAAGGGQAFRQQAGERRRRASSLQLASPPVATRNGLACLLAECAILTHKFCHRALLFKRSIAFIHFFLHGLFERPPNRRNAVPPNRR